MTTFTYLSIEEMKAKHHHPAPQGTMVIGLEKDEALVGYVEFKDAGDNELSIEMLSVKNEHQQKGYSTLLLNEVLNQHHHTVAFVGESTAEAVAFWTAKGAVFNPETYHEYQPEDTLDDKIDFEGLLFAFSLNVQEESAHTPYWEAS